MPASKLVSLTDLLEALINRSPRVKWVEIEMRVNDLPPIRLPINIGDFINVLHSEWGECLDNDDCDHGFLVATTKSGLLDTKAGAIKILSWYVDTSYD